MGLRGWLLLNIILLVSNVLHICQCDPEHKFTCWNGKCISLELRCNEQNNCGDESDEYKCDFVLFDKGQYRKAQVPKSPSKQGGPLKIHVGLDVIEIVDVDVPNVSLPAQMK